MCPALCHIILPNTDLFDNQPVWFKHSFDFFSPSKMFPNIFVAAVYTQCFAVDYL